MKKHKQNKSRARIIPNESAYLEQQFLSNFPDERDYFGDRIECVFDEIDYKCQSIGIYPIVLILHNAIRAHELS